MADLSGSKVTFFLATADADRSKAFYTGQLGLQLLDDSPYGLVLALAGSELRISKVTAFTPFAWTVLDWQVADLGASMAALRGSGVDFVRFEGMDQDADGVWSVPGGGARIAWFKDPDGNVLSVSQRT